MNSSVLIIGYRRYSNIVKLIRSSLEMSTRRVYLALDGLGEIDQVERNSFLTQIDDLLRDNESRFICWMRDSNLGPAVSVITAIDWFFTKESQGIILEDDLIISPQTLAYFDEALDFYLADVKVQLISGSQFWDFSASHCETPWSSYPITWGWATWRERWQQAREIFFINKYRKLTELKLREELFWQVGCDRCLCGLQDAWDILFATYLISNKKICIFPAVNLISNVGADVFAGNTINRAWPLFMPISQHPHGETMLTSRELRQPDCIDTLIRETIYRIRWTNLLTGLFYWVRRILLSTKYNNRNYLGNRINTTEIPL